MLRSLPLMPRVRIGTGRDFRDLAGGRAWPHSPDEWFFEIDGEFIDAATSSEEEVVEEAERQLYEFHGEVVEAMIRDFVAKGRPAAARALMERQRKYRLAASERAAANGRTLR